MKVRFVVNCDYEIPDDLKKREEMYGTTDIEECLRIDATIPVDDLLSFSEVEIVSMKVLDSQPTEA